MNTRTLLTLAAASLAGVSVPAGAQVELTRSVFSASGATVVGSGALVLSGTVGQDVAGRASVGAFILDAGFWNPAGPAIPTCPADINADGNLDPDDLSDYITCFFNAPPCGLADFNHDVDINPDDLADFITAFFTGCP